MGLRASPNEAVSMQEPFLVFALWTAIVLSVLEGAARYGLHLVNADQLIFLRDFLILGGLLACIAKSLPRGELPMSIGIFTILLLIHGAVSLANFGTLIPAIYGLKIFIPALCAFMVAPAIINPSKRVFIMVVALWIASVLAAILDQYWVTFPWVGLQVELGGLDVQLGRDWQSGASIERVGGLARSSIGLAVSLPVLSFIILTRVRSRSACISIGVATFIVLVWTTQKGAIAGYALALVALALSNSKSFAPLKFSLLLAMVFMALSPTLLIHLDMPRDQGVFSFASFIERIERMWPGAWQWINRYPPFSGTGLGGISGAQRFFAPEDVNAVDNLWLYLFGNFGYASLLYVAGIVIVALNLQASKSRIDRCVLAAFTFLMFYGVVISLIEEQSAAIWLGATFGWLAHRQKAFRFVTQKVVANKSNGERAQTV